MKHLVIIILVLNIYSCKSDKQITYNSTIDAPLLVNDSVDKFFEIDKKIKAKIELETSFNNIVTAHFKKRITKKALKTVKFEEWKRNIYIEFSLNKDKRITQLNTNASNKKLNEQLKLAFKKFNINLFEFPKYDSRYKYTLVVIQPDINGEPIVKCSEKLIAYAPPVFEICNGETTYQDLNRCNYLYISNYINNSLDLNLVNMVDLDNNHQLLPKFIVDETGKVIAAKIESENKELLENYFTTIKKLPNALKPAKINDEPFYFGYTFPSSISSLIRKSDGFREYYLYKKDNGKDIYQNIRDYLSLYKSNTKHRQIKDSIPL